MTAVLTQADGAAVEAAAQDSIASHLRNLLQILIGVDDRMESGDGYVTIHLTEIEGIRNRAAAAILLAEEYVTHLDSAIAAAETQKAQFDELLQSRNDAHDQTHSAVEAHNSTVAATEVHSQTIAEATKAIRLTLGALLVAGDRIWSVTERQFDDISNAVEAIEMSTAALVLPEDSGAIETAKAGGKILDLMDALKVSLETAKSAEVT